MWVDVTKWEIGYVGRCYKMGDRACGELRNGTDDGRLSTPKRNDDDDGLNGLKQPSDVPTPRFELG